MFLPKKDFIKKDCPLYEFFGSHEHSDGFVFRVLAPNADDVFLVGDFCGWEEGIPMEKIDGGVWECTVSSAPGFGNFSNYKYRIVKNGRIHYRSDPYAFHFEPLPGAASRFFNINDFKWMDNGWLGYRRQIKADGIKVFTLDILKNTNGSPLHSDSSSRLASYVKKTGYTHIRISPVMEGSNASDEKSGVYGYFAPTSLLGTPGDFMRLINELHMSGVGVILDIPIEGLSSDEQGLLLFDGERLYEKVDTTGAAMLDLGKPAARSILTSAVDFWIRIYHADGIRICGGIQTEQFHHNICSSASREFPNIIFCTDDRQ